MCSFLLTTTGNLVRFLLLPARRSYVASLSACATNTESNQVQQVDSSELWDLPSSRLTNHVTFH